MGRTPTPSGGQNIETIAYRAPKPPAGTDARTGSRASYTPVGGPAPTATAASYGKSGGAANAQRATVPAVVVGGASEVAPVPGLTGTLTVGVDRNVSTPVTGL